MNRPFFKRGGEGGGAKGKGGVGGRGRGKAVPTPTNTTGKAPDLATRRSERRKAAIAAREQPASGSLAAKALTALRSMTKGSGRVQLSDLKDRLGNPSQGAFRDAVLKLQDQGHAVLYRNDITKKVSARDKAAEITVGDSPRNLIYLDE